MYTINGKRLSDKDKHMRIFQVAENQSKYFLEYQTWFSAVFTSARKSRALNGVIINDVIK